jgi:tetratricopeptide (TPR) repeat protein
MAWSGPFGRAAGRFDGFVMMNILKNIISRVFVVYLIVAAGFFFCTQYKTVIRSAELQTLSRLTPSFNYYTEIFDKRDNSSLARLEECAYYHERVVDLVPSAAGEALGVAAFCRYEEGQPQKARDLLQKAIAKSPVFFWNSYNLGIMSLNSGDYEHAAEAFAEALKLDPKYTLLILARSKVYNDIRRSFGGIPYNIEANLAEGYRRTNILLKICVVCHADPQTTVCSERQRLHLQLF